jgi:hypothetical protein
MMLGGKRFLRDVSLIVNFSYQLLTRRQPRLDLPHQIQESVSREHVTRHFVVVVHARLMALARSDDCHEDDAQDDSADRRREVVDDRPGRRFSSFQHSNPHPTTHLNAIFFDSDKSKAPIALVIDETNSGTIKHFSILKNKSPGN